HHFGAELDELFPSEGFLDVKGEAPVGSQIQTAGGCGMGRKALGHRPQQKLAETKSVNGVDGVDPAQIEQDHSPLRIAPTFAVRGHHRPQGPAVWKAREQIQLADALKLQLALLTLGNIDANSF